MTRQLSSDESKQKVVRSKLIMAKRKNEAIGTICGIIGGLTGNKIGTEIDRED